MTDAAYTKLIQATSSFSPDEATGIGIVAYGADYEAKLDVAWISLV
ncbi:MAG: hypothetical protein AAGL92_15105 [Pseudomonadota bacterium]